MSATGKNGVSVGQPMPSILGKWGLLEVGQGQTGWAQSSQSTCGSCLSAGLSEVSAGSMPLASCM